MTNVTGPRLMLAVAVIMIASVPSFAQQRCENLTRLLGPGLKITSATPVPAGPFVVPGQTESVDMPSFCRVLGIVAPEVRFELWLPTNWNRKLLAVGNGGLAGSFVYRPMLKPLREGYATSTTDTGHIGTDTTDGSWALGHYERVVDFADRAVHVMAEADKLVLRAFYGTPPLHSFFSGCSQGGHEALVEAQRYPSDFDGIIAGDPANNWTRHYIGAHLWIAHLMQGDGYIPPSKIPLIGDAVNKACDALDGIKDGILNDPRRCHFDPSTLLCKGADESTCLTKAQVESVRQIWTGLRTPDGDQIYPGLVPGGENSPTGWITYISGTGPGTGRHTLLALPFFRYIVFEDANWDFKTFRFDAPEGFDSDIDFTLNKVGALFDATNPDLSVFKATGGKLIQYHGWSDPDISPLNSINYYEAVVNTMARNGVHGLRNTKDFYRLFMVPGMNHCQGGPGPANFDMIEPLDHWVEQGIAPEKVIASHVTNGTVDRTRPLCPYPEEAQWKESGSTDDAANFICALPSLP